jgi:hypothetical protein
MVAITDSRMINREKVRWGLKAILLAINRAIFTGINFVHQK